MKKLLLCLLLIGFVSHGNSQTLLKEVKVEYTPVSMKIDPVSNSLEMMLPESWHGEFQQNPLQFVKTNFDGRKLVEDNGSSDFVYYEVNFKSRKGNLLATFDKKGELTSSSQRFRDVILPSDVKHEIFNKYRDSKLLSNKYVAFSKGWNIEKELYTVKIQDGKKVRKIKVKKQADRYAAY